MEKKSLRKEVWETLLQGCSESKARGVRRGGWGAALELCPVPMLSGGIPLVCWARFS